MRRLRLVFAASALALASLAPLAPLSFVAVAQAAEPDRVESASGLAARGDYAGALKELEQAKGAQRGAALVEKGRLELLLGKYADAVKTGKAAIALGKEHKLEGAPIAAQGLAAQGKLADAVALLKTVTTEDQAYRAKVLLGELLIQQGKRKDADVPLREVISAYNADEIKDSDAVGLSLVGRAAQLLRNAKSANEAFNRAERVGGKKLVETLLWRAELFLDKYDPGHAGEVVREAVKLAPRHPLARVWYAKVKLDGAYDFDGADSEITQALEVNPNLPAAYFVRAGLHLRDLDTDEADKVADQGLAIDPTNLELLSLKAAIRFLADDAKGFEEAKKKVLAQNPEYTRMYQIIGEFAEWEHRYEEIVKMMQEAVAIDPNDAKALGQLGLNLIRTNDDKAGLEALQKAFAKDKYNVRVFNTLNLFEKAVATEYVDVAGTQFVIRYHKEEKRILERYVPRMLEEAYGSMVKRYGFTPKEPTHVELYADSEHFAVRTSGLPSVGIQGVCFGQTLAALSPAAAPWNWGNVLWHELGHVFAIQQSKNHVPRWFTEGLSEYETIVRRPEWQREEDPALYAAFKAGRVPKVASFNRAFTHVDSVDEVVMAYYAASQLLVFMTQEFGFQKVVSMLPRWADGKRTPQVVQEALGIGTDELDKRFRGFLDRSLARYKTQFVPDLHSPPLDEARKAVKAAPNDARKLLELALALFQEDQGPEGEAVLAEALKKDPNQPDVNFLLLRKAFRSKDLAGAQKLADKLIANGGDGYAVRMKAADLAEVAMAKADQEKKPDDAKKHLARMKEHLGKAAEFDPSMAEPVAALYDLAKKADDEEGQLAALRRLSALDQNDRRVWIRLLRLLVKRGLWEEARVVGEGALFVDVSSPEVHRLYARALARTGRFVSAVFELNSAILCKPPTEELVEIYGELAKAYAKLGEGDFEKQALEWKRSLENVPKAKKKTDDDELRRDDEN